MWKDWISIDYHISRIEIHDYCIVGNWTESKYRLFSWCQQCITSAIFHLHIYFYISLQTSTASLYFTFPISLKSHVFHMVCFPFPIWKSEKWFEQRILEEILQYPRVHPSEKTFYSNLKFIPSDEKLLAYKQQISWIRHFQTSTLCIS